MREKDRLIISDDYRYYCIPPYNYLLELSTLLTILFKIEIHKFALTFNAPRCKTNIICLFATIRYSYYGYSYYGLCHNKLFFFMLLCVDLH